MSPTVASDGSVSGVRFDQLSLGGGAARAEEGNSRATTIRTAARVMSATVPARRPALRALVLCLTELLQFLERVAGALQEGPRVVDLLAVADDAEVDAV